MVLQTRGLVRAGLATAVAALLSVTVTAGPAFAQEDGKETETSTAAQSESKTDKPNILVIWGDDIGTWNISHNNRGMMGYKTPNIDRIANEGLSFTDYYGLKWSRFSGQSDGAAKVYSAV